MNELRQSPRASESSATDTHCDDPTSSSPADRFNPQNASENGSDRPVDPPLSHRPSSVDEAPPSFFMRATNYITTSTGAAKGIIGEGVSSIAPSAPENFGSRGAMWRWMTGGGGTTISSSRSGRGTEGENNADAPVTLSLPSRTKRGVEPGERISVRATSNPKVDLALVGSKSSKSSLSFGPRINSAQAQSGARGNSLFSSFASDLCESCDDDDVEISNQSQLLSAFKSFVNVHATVSAQTSKGGDNKSDDFRSSAESDGIEKLPFDMEDMTLEEIASMLRECACQSSQNLSLADISDLISDALQFDSTRGTAEATDRASPCQCARLLILLHSILLFEDEGQDVTIFVDAGIEAILAGWSGAQGKPRDNRNGRQSQFHNLYAKYIQSKASFLSTTFDTFDGSFSFSRLLRRLEIEAVDHERSSRNKKTEAQLFSAETLQRVVELITDLCDVLLALEKSVTVITDEDDECSPNASSAGTADMLQRCTPFDAASTELALYVLALDAFCACRTIEKLVQHDGCRSDLAATRESVSRVLEACHMIKHVRSSYQDSEIDAQETSAQKQKTLLSDALIPPADGVYRFHESNFGLFGGMAYLTVSSCLSRPVQQELIATSTRKDGSTEIQHFSPGDDTEFRACKKISSTQQSCRTREIDCTFSTITTLHSAFGREIRKRAESEVQ